MAFFDDDAMQYAGLLASLPTFSGRRNPINPLAPYFLQAGARKRQEEKERLQLEAMKQQAAQAHAQQQAQSEAAFMLSPQSQRAPSITANLTPQEYGQTLLSKGIQAGNPAITNYAQGLLAPKKDTYRTVGPGQTLFKNDTPVFTGKPNQSDEYKDVWRDDLGTWYARQGGKVVKLPYAPGTEKGVKYKTVQGTNESGVPITELVNPAVLSPSKGRIQVGKKGLSSDQAGKSAMLMGGKKQLPLVKSLMFNKDGTPNMTNIAAAQYNIPKTDGRQMAAAMEVGIQAITRLETGAAMPPGEVKNTRTRFQPSILDDEATIKLKMSMYEDFLNQSLKLLNQDGTFNTEKFDQELERRKSMVEPSIDDLIKMYAK